MPKAPRAPASIALGLLTLASPAPAQLTALGANLLEECGAALEDCETNDRFGDALAVGDFDDDGFADLAVGVPSEDVGAVNAAGAIHVFYGGPAGLVFGASVEAIFDAIDLGGTAGGGANFGAALAAGDFDCDGFDDLAVGEPDANVGDAGDAGRVFVLWGSEGGLEAAGSLAFTQNNISDVETSEDGDHFGFSLAAGRIDSGCRDDLVIGVPGEDLIPLFEDDAGVIHILYNSGSSPLAREQRKTQHDAGCGPDNGAGDQFGYALAVGDIAGSSAEDGFAEVLVGAPFEDDEVDGEVDRGAAYLFQSSSGGLGDAQCPSFTVIANGAAAGDRAGGAVAIGGLESDGDGAPIAGSAGDFSEAGSLVVMLGAGASRPVYDQNDLDHATRESGDHFAAALAVGDFDADGLDDLAVGAPDDDVEGASNAGEIGVFYGTAAGLASVGQSAFHSNLPASMPDSPNSSDHFGAALAAGDFDGNGSDDLAIGVPGEALGAETNAGMVTVVYGLDRALGAFGTTRFAGDGSEAIAESAGSEFFFLVRAGGAVVAASVDRVRTGGTATPGVDFNYTDNTESWGVGDLSPEPFPIAILDDTLDEPNETVVLALEDPTPGLALGTPATLTITIVDDDVAGALSFTQPVYVALYEDSGSFTVAVQRSGGAASGVTVQFATSNGSATAAQDYLPASGTLTFDAGQNVRTFGITLLDDGVAEPAETINLTLVNPGGGGTLGTFPTAVLVLVDDDIFLDGFESGDTAAWSATVSAAARSRAARTTATTAPTTRSPAATSRSPTARPRSSSPRSGSPARTPAWAI